MTQRKQNKHEQITNLFCAMLRWKRRCFARDCMRFSNLGGALACSWGAYDWRVRVGQIECWMNIFHISVTQVGLVLCSLTAGSLVGKQQSQSELCRWDWEFCVRARRMATIMKNNSRKMATKIAKILNLHICSIVIESVIWSYRSNCYHSIGKTGT